MRFVALLGALALASCGSAERDAEAPSFGDRVRMITVAQSAVREKLRDPDAAQFRNEKVGEFAGKKVICGEVNSNNALGGKAGYQRYVSDGGAATVLEEQMTAADFRDVWTKMGC